MATTSFLGRDAAFSKEGRLQHAYSSLNAVSVRPSTVAAKKFFSDTDGTSNDWKSLPDRVERLCQSLEAWVSY